MTPSLSMFLQFSSCCNLSLFSLKFFASFNVLFSCFVFHCLIWSFRLLANDSNYCKGQFNLRTHFVYFLINFISLSLSLICCFLSPLANMHDPRQLCMISLSNLEHQQNKYFSESLFKFNLRQLCSSIFFWIESTETSLTKATNLRLLFSYIDTLHLLPK